MVLLLVLCKLKEKTMKNFNKLIFILSIALASCAGPKSYFTIGIRSKIENKSIPLSQLQFYVDRDVELRRELSTGDAKVNSGKIKFENGKYIHIILLKKFTPGVCTQTYPNSLDVSFELGDGKNLTFGVPNQASSDYIYQIFALEWIKNNRSLGEMGRITYDNKTYYIQPNGTSAKLMIKKSVVDKLEISKRVMKGRKVE